MHFDFNISEATWFRLKGMFVFEQGGREVDDFIKYLAREATTPLSSYSRDGKKIKSKKGKVEL